MLICKGLFYLSLTVWLMADVEVEAYKSGCSGGYCFVISDINDNNERTEQPIAKGRCQSNGTQLIEILSKDIQNSLVNFIRKVYSQGVSGWNVLTNGKRTSGNWIRLNDNSIGSIDINEQKDLSYAYGYLKPTGSGFDLFASRPTDNKGGFICAGLSDCSGVTIDDQCYKSFSETLSWYDARNRCLDGGGDLATFDHITTKGGFKALIWSWLSTSTSYWIGIRRESWTWQSSKSDVKYTEWLNGHPLNEIDRANADCLCLSTTQWKWIECGCNQQLPFVCLLENSTTSSAPATKPTTTETTLSTTAISPTFASRSTVTASTTKVTQSVSKSGASETSGVPSLSIPPTETPKSTPDANNTEIVETSKGLNKEAAIGIGVGVGVGGAVVIIALVATAIILYRKRYPMRCCRKNPTNTKPKPPNMVMRDSANYDHSGSHGIENPYAQVVSSSPESNRANTTNAYENISQPPIVYDKLAFCTEPQIHRNAIGSVMIVPGKAEPSSSPDATPSETSSAINHFNMKGDLYAAVTKA